MPLPKTAPRGPLPPGTRTIGQLLHWMGNRNRAASRRRVAFVPDTDKDILIFRCIHAILPWKVYEYPGRARYLAALCRLSPKSAAHYLAAPVKPSRPVLLTLAATLRGRAALFLSLADEAEAAAVAIAPRGTAAKRKSAAARARKAHADAPL